MCKIIKVYLMVSTWWQVVANFLLVVPEKAVQGKHVSITSSKVMGNTSVKLEKKLSIIEVLDNWIINNWRKLSKKEKKIIAFKVICQRGCSFVKFIKY